MNGHRDKEQQNSQDEHEPKMSPINVHFHPPPLLHLSVAFAPRTASRATAGIGRYNASE